ncbi:MAG TPA: di-heme oxidoredictase family protein, partial [Candidatus Poseidoniales archaeon]|nr:di-heme oxidoredictase family protein [Candidatus Poseidoniales archaeon]
TCGSCHADDARGPGVVQKMVVVKPDGITPKNDQSLLPWGSGVRPQVAGGASEPIRPPEGIDNLLVTIRMPPAVFGRGYIEAVMDSEIERVASLQAETDDGVSGKINRVPWTSEDNPDQDYHGYQYGDSQLIGRFGLKATIATVDDFTADAYQADMSITSPMRPDELANPEGLTDDYLPGVDIDLETVNLTADYVRMLEIPERVQTDPEGPELFEESGCATCHVPTMRTSPGYPVGLLADIDAPIFTDMLLHDMGDEAADGMEQHDAGSTEWRTAPLMGLRFLRNMMHDGRAKTVREAIDAHEGPGSEANGSIELFQQMSAEDQDALVAYVETL